MSDAPFKKGDVLCSTGPGLRFGRHIHVAGEPILRQGKWNNGFRPWGKQNDDVEMRHATVADFDYVLTPLYADLKRTTDRITVLQQLRAMVQQALTTTEE